MSQRLIGYRCLSCGREHSVDPFRYVCEKCGNNLDALYDYDLIKRQWSKAQLSANPDQSIWRYAPVIPVASSPEQRSIRVGGTPLVDAPNLARRYNLRQVLVKDDTRNPSGSLKDRASEVGLRHVAELGQKLIVAASTGNAAASLACLSACHGQKALILAPASAPKTKLTQILQYGALLCPIDGSYEQAFDLVTELVEEFGWYSRNTGQNPVLSEGKKTVALEIAEQLDWQVPGAVFVPVGDGCIIGGVYKGFYDLLQLGWIDRLPRIVAVQAAGSAAIANAINSDQPIEAVQADTVADSIAVDLPRDGLKALRAVRDSGGTAIVVSDDRILAAQRELSSSTGIFAEPAASAAFAGLLAAWEKELVAADERVVVLATGSGLKDIPAAGRQLEWPEAVAPSIKDFRSFYEDTLREN